MGKSLIPLHPHSTMYRLFVKYYVSRKVLSKEEKVPLPRRRAEIFCVFGGDGLIKTLLYNESISDKASKSKESILARASSTARPTSAAQSLRSDSVPGRSIHLSKSDALLGQVISLRSEKGLTPRTHD